MLHFDKVSSFYSKIKNSIKTKKTEMLIENNSQILSLVKIFYKLGYIQKYTINNKYICVSLKYYKENILLRNIYLISSPGRMIYCKNYKISVYHKNNYNVIINTSKGLLTLNEAIQTNLGGFVIFIFK